MIYKRRAMSAITCRSHVTGCDVRSTHFRPVFARLFALTREPLRPPRNDLSRNELPRQPLSRRRRQHQQQGDTDNNNITRYSERSLHCCYHDIVIAAVHSVHLMNVEQRNAAADPQTSQLQQLYLSCVLV